MFHRMRSHRNKQYLDFVRSRPSCISGAEQNIVAHHVRCLGGGGTGLKPSDYLTVPLTTEEHSRLHSEGEASYWARHGLKPEEMIRMTLLIFSAHIESDELTEKLIDAIEVLR